MLSLAYSYTAPAISFQPRIDETSNKLVTALTNSKNNKYFSINLSLPFKITDWWNSQNNIWGNWNQSNNFYKINIRTEGVSAYIQSTQTFTLPKDISLELSANYSTKGKWGLYSNKASGSLDFGAQKKFIKKKSSLSFNIRNILNTGTYKSYIIRPEQNLILKIKETLARNIFFGFER